VGRRAAGGGRTSAIDWIAVTRVAPNRTPGARRSLPRAVVQGRRLRLAAEPPRQGTEHAAAAAPRHRVGSGASASTCLGGDGGGESERQLPAGQYTPSAATATAGFSPSSLATPLISHPTVNPSHRPPNRNPRALYLCCWDWELEPLPQASRSRHCAPPHHSP